MSDRERMILTIKGYYESLKPGFKGNPVEIADRLIEAGFGRVGKKSEKCPACGKEYRDNSGSCPHGCHSNFSWIKEYGL